MNEIRKFLNLFLRVFMPCVYGITIAASFIGTLLILSLAPVWTWPSILVTIPLGIASGLRLYQLLTPYIND
jgi:hypothetical protein